METIDKTLQIRERGKRLYRHKQHRMGLWHSFIYMDKVYIVVTTYFFVK